MAYLLPEAQVDANAQAELSMRQYSFLMISLSAGYFGGTVLAHCPLLRLHF